MESSPGPGIPSFGRIRTGPRVPKLCPARVGLGIPKITFPAPGIPVDDWQQSIHSALNLKHTSTSKLIIICITKLLGDFSIVIKNLKKYSNNSIPNFIHKLCIMTYSMFIYKQLYKCLNIKQLNRDPLNATFHADAEYNTIIRDINRVQALLGGVQPHFFHFCPSPNSDFDVSWEKMGKNVQKWGKKYMEREGKIIHFSKLLTLYYHYFWHINYYY